MANPMEIPEQAKRVFTGVIFDVWHWEQEMFDGSKETFEMLSRPDTVTIIPTMNGKILLGEEEQPHYGTFLSLFGGRRDEGEDPLDTAKRELLEETGLRSDDWELLSTVQPYAKFRWDVYTFAARNCEPSSPADLDPGERIAVREMDFEEFVHVACSEEFRSKHLALELLRMRANEAISEFKEKLLPQSSPPE